MESETHFVLEKNDLGLDQGMLNTLYHNLIIDYSSTYQFS